MKIPVFKLTLLALIIFGASTVGLNYVSVKKAEAACGTPYSGTGFFFGGSHCIAPDLSPYNVMLVSDPGGIPSFNGKPDYINYMKFETGTKTHRGLMASYVIMHNLYDYSPSSTTAQPHRPPTSAEVAEWVNRMSNPDIDLTSDNRSYNNTTFRSPVPGSPGQEDIFKVTPYPSIGRDVWKIYNKKNSDVYTEIEKKCMNQVDRDVPTPVLPKANVKPEAWVTGGGQGPLKNITVAPGTTVLFENNVIVSNAESTSPYRFAYTIEDVYNNMNTPVGSSLARTQSDYNNGQVVKPDPPGTGVPRWYSFQVPANAPLNSTYCRRTQLDPVSFENFAVHKPDSDMACVKVAQTTITPATVGQPNPISTGQTTNFAHTVTTTNYVGPSKNYIWNVYLKVISDPLLAGSGSWTKCADENGTCSFSGVRTVRYGQYGPGSAWVTINNVNGSIGCNNGVFTDPMYGTVKLCEYLDSGTGIPAGYNLIRSGNGTTNGDGSVKILDDPQVGIAGAVQICEMLVLSHVNPAVSDGLTIINMSEDCVTVAGAIDRNVTMQANANGPITVEPEQQAVGGRVWSSVNGGTTPQLNPKEWGYNQDAKPATATIVPEHEDPKSPKDMGQRDDPRSNPATKSELCNTNIAGCPKFVPAQYGWFCGSTYVGDAGSSPNPGCPYTVSQHQWKCPDPAQAQTDWMDDPSKPTCNSWYDPTPCADGRGGYWAAPGGRSCPDTWNCPMQGTMLPWGRGQPICEYRCENGLGNFGPLSTASTATSANGRVWQVHAGTDIHCYKQWQFQVRCTYGYIGSWRYSPPTNNLTTITVDVNPGTDLNNICPRDYSYYGGMVGDSACVEISALPVMQPTGSFFMDNNTTILLPGRINATFPKRWGVVSNPNRAQQCFQTIARPYVSFDKTDVRALLPGSGAITTYGSWNGGDFYGSGVGYAAFANGAISDFKTYGNNAENRAFSNTGYSAAGGNWGGNFHSANTKTYANMRDMVIKGPTECRTDLNNITKVTVIYCGDADITLTSEKTTVWTAAAPNSVYIVAPTIRINSNVANLNGVALIANNIDTCADRGNGCANKLTLTGSIWANKINFWRAANGVIGSSLYCARPSRPGDLPAGVPTTCDTYGNPGEVINYSPEFSLSPPPFQAISGATTGKYDSIRSLPPIY